jgi:hypothetical protein
MRTAPATAAFADTIWIDRHKVNCAGASWRYGRHSSPHPFKQECPHAQHQWLCFILAQEQRVVFAEPFLERDEAAEAVAFAAMARRSWRHSRLGFGTFVLRNEIERAAQRT